MSSLTRFQRVLAIGLLYLVMAVAMNCLDVNSVEADAVLVGFAVASFALWTKGRTRQRT